MPGLKAAQRPVAFVAFCNKIFAERIPMRVASENRNFRTDVMRRMEASFAQNVRCHRRGGRFSMHSCDEDRTLCSHDCGKHLRPPHGRFPEITRAQKDRIINRDRRGKDDEIGVAGVVRMMILMKTQTKPSQSIRLHGAGFVGAANLVPKLEQKCRDTAHPAAGYADKMNLMMLTREQFRKIKLRGVLHGSYISPWL